MKNTLFAIALVTVSAHCCIARRPPPPPPPGCSDENPCQNEDDACIGNICRRTCSSDEDCDRHPDDICTTTLVEGISRVCGKGCSKDSDCGNRPWDACSAEGICKPPAHHPRHGPHCHRHGGPPPLCNAANPCPSPNDACVNNSCRRKCQSNHECDRRPDSACASGTVDGLNRVCGKSCKVAADCDRFPGATCESGICLKPAFSTCVAPTDCPEEHTCDDKFGLCVPPPRPKGRHHHRPLTCSTNQDCELLSNRRHGGAFNCVEQICRKICSSASDCRPGDGCAADGYCPLPELD